MGDDEPAIGPAWEGLLGTAKGQSWTDRHGIDHWHPDTPARLQSASTRMFRAYMESSIAHGFAKRGKSHEHAEEILATAEEAIAEQQKETSMGTQEIADRREQILELLKNRGPLKTVEIAKQIGAKPSAVTYTLRALKDENHVELRGKTNAARWALPGDDRAPPAVKAPLPARKQTNGHRRVDTKPASAKASTVIGALQAELAKARDRVAKLEAAIEVLS